MTEPKPPPKKKKREKSKTTLWEKRRRSRLNEHFNKLWQALPVYDASRPLSKPEILIQAAAALRELDERLRHLLSPEQGRASEQKLKVSGDVIKKLEERVRKLLLRNEQLSNLVRSAGVKVPSDYAKKFKKAPKYANALTKEQQACAIQKELEKENQEKGGPKTKKPKARAKLKERNPKTKKKQLNCVLVMSQPTLPNSSYVIVSRGQAKARQTAPRPKPALKPLPQPPPMRVLGVVMPVLPPLMPTQLIVVSSKGDARPRPQGGLNCLPVLRPKTTQANKVPIPALASKYNRFKNGKRAADDAPKEPKPKRAKSGAAPKGEPPVGPRAEPALEEKAASAAAPEGAAKAANEPERAPEVPQTELSNDIFASFQVPPGCQNPESTSPTAAFLLAFPLVSSGAKAAETLGDEATESQTGTPNLLQIGTMDMSKPAPPFPDSLTPPNLFDSFSFFNNKEGGNASGFFNTMDGLTRAQDKGKCEPKAQHKEPKSAYLEGDSFAFKGQSESCAGAKFNYPAQQFWEGDMFGDNCAPFGASCKQAKSQKPVNWMTAPATTTTPSYFLPPFSKEAKPPPRLLNSNGYFNESQEFPWAAPKVPQFLDSAPSFVSSTLPTLVGDLALNNAPAKGRRKGGLCEGGANFLSVSQLVDQQEGGARRGAAKAKPKRRPEPPKSGKSVRSSSYSAEALISSDLSAQRPKSFLNDNMSYFPATVQDNSYMGSNQGYQTAFHQNNSFDAYIPPPPNNFMVGQDFVDAPDYPKEKGACKKTKKRPPNDNVLPSFDMHFFSMPGAVNSPILPDDFHTTYLPPTTLYSCKTPLYSKASSEASFMPPLGGRPAHQPQMSPSVNTGGTSLTNFNLSTIFPEINKGPTQDSFPASRSSSKGFGALHSGPFLG